MSTIKTNAKGGLYLLTKRYTGRFHKYFNELQKSQWFSREELRDLQNHKLQNMITYAYNNVPYYQKLFKRLSLTPDDIVTTQDLKKLPFLDKETIRTRGDDFLSQKMNRLFLRRAYTSGTSGKPLILYRNMSSIVYEYAALQRQYTWGGVDGRERVATLLGEKIAPADQNKPPFWRYNIPENKLVMSSYHLSNKNADAYLEALLKFQPVAVEGYPSSVYTMARFIAERMETIPVKAVFTTSETLSLEQRKLIQKVFQCRVFDYYGMAERVVAIHTCEYGNYHILPEYGVVELARIKSDSHDTIYELIGTGLNNFAMPLIRYRLGDTVEFADKKCPCGRNHPIVNSILGRCDDYIVTSQGSLVGRLDHVFKGAKNIVEAQIIQESLKSLEVKIVPDKEFCREDSDYICEELKARVGSDVSIRINLVQHIPRSKAGKLQATLSNIKNEYIKSISDPEFDMDTTQYYE